jgi:hypothetical protein
MPFSLRVPFSTAERTVAPAGVAVTLRAYQPVVWVRLTPWEPSDTPLAAISFPTVVDTGNNHSFLVPGSLFRAWTGLDVRNLEAPHRVLANGILVGCYPFNLELMRVRAGQPTEHRAAHLKTDRGVVVIPEDQESRFPRMPVLGVRTLCFNRVTFTLNGARQTFALTQPPRPAGG